LITTEAKKAHFFVHKQTGFVHQKLKDFLDMTLTPVSSHNQFYLYLTMYEKVRLLSTYHQVPAYHGASFWHDVVL